MKKALITGIGSVHLFEHESVLPGQWLRW